MQVTEQGEGAFPSYSLSQTANASLRFTAIQTMQYLGKRSPGQKYLLFTALLSD
jgi:hypothetical protein